MRELKEIELGEAYKVFDDDKEFYLKSEADKVIAYHKYKRCLAMALWCDRMFSITFGKEQYWQKWNRRWLELAEVFK